ncbi:MAG: hypothetical protein OQJ80_04820, partial [Kangiella sp.]|nr:hypothetical protein [Kangiella sp.]
MNKFLALLVLGFATLLTQSANTAQDLSQAKQLCENASEQQRQMARAAGYDVDGLCASLQNQASSNSQQTFAENPILPREIEQFPLEEKQKELDQELEEGKPKVDQKLEKFG